MQSVSVPVIADIVLRQLSSIRALTHNLGVARRADSHHFTVTKVFRNKLGLLIPAHGKTLNERLL